MKTFNNNLEAQMRDRTTIFLAGVTLSLVGLVWWRVPGAPYVYYPIAAALWQGLFRTCLLGSIKW